jgi:UPF0755 protein
MVLHKITVPEGFTVRQIAELFAEKGVSRADDVPALEADDAFKKGLGIPADGDSNHRQGLEGYLFPDTYQYIWSDTERDIVEMMVKRFFEIYDAGMRSRQNELGMSMREILTLASIIEKETGAPQERPHIAVVFYNRLRKGMRLQSDPTVIYGLGERYAGNLTRRDLDEATPYNTYQIPALPPGPICNPGKAALEAALWPAASDDLYFVSRNDGTHEFSADYTAHVRAVNRYQRGAGRTE